MEGRSFTYNLKDIELTAESIARVIGYTTEEIPEYVSELIAQTLTIVQDQVSIKAEYRVFEDIVLDMQKGSIAFASTNFLTRKIILPQLIGSTHAALFLLSAGPEIGDLSKRQMSDGDLLEAYITDVIGSEIVEAAADKMQADLRVEAESNGLNITNRFSPGYCGWDVAEQQQLFALMPDNFCGITLRKSSLMIPIKSISGMIGLGKEARYQPYACNRCDSKNCIYRNKRGKA